MDHSEAIRDAIQQAVEWLDKYTNNFAVVASIGFQCRVGEDDAHVRAMLRRLREWQREAELGMAAGLGKGERDAMAKLILYLQCTAQIASPSQLAPFLRERLSPFLRQRLSPFVRERLSPFVRERLSPFFEAETFTLFEGETFTLF